MKKVYVTPKQQVSITCDDCGGTYTNKMPMHIRGNMPVKAKCRCGNDIDMIFEFRQAYRKPTSLRGLLQKHGSDSERQAIQVHNLSQGGIKIATRERHNFHHDDVCMLTFTLDNPPRSQIDKQIRVKYIHGQIIGAQFCPEDQFSYQKEIGYYLMG